MEEQITTNKLSHYAVSYQDLRIMIQAVKSLLNYIELQEELSEAMDPFRKVYTKYIADVDYLVDK